MSAEARAEPGAVSSAGPGFGRAAGLRWCGRLALVAALLAPLIVAVWLAAAPLRFIVAITTEPQDFHEDHPAEE